MKFVTNFLKEDECIYKKAIELTKVNLIIKEEAYNIYGILNSDTKSLWLTDGHEKDDLDFFWRILNEVIKGYTMLQLNNNITSMGNNSLISVEIDMSKVPKNLVVVNNGNDKDRNELSNLSKQDRRELLMTQINYCLDIYPLNQEELKRLSEEFNKL